MRCPGMEKSRAHAAASHLWLNSTSTTLGSARVERSPRSFSLRAICRRTRRMILPAGRVKSFSFRRKRRNWECKKTKAPSTWTCFGKPWSILDEIWGGYWSDLLPYWMTKQNKVSKCEIDWDLLVFNLILWPFLFSSSISVRLNSLCSFSVMKQYRHSPFTAWGRLTTAASATDGCSDRAASTSAVLNKWPERRDGTAVNTSLGSVN